MTNKEMVWRALLLERRERVRWQQQELAERLGLGVATVNAALRVPRRVGAVRVGGRGFELAHWRKLRMIWAVFRDPDKDVLARTHLRLPAADVEGGMIPQVRFTGPSGYRFACGHTPAHYDRVWVYVEPEHLPALRERLAADVDRHGQTELTVLAPDRLLGETVPLEQVYVDLWQMADWWAAEFIQALEVRLDG